MGKPMLQQIYEWSMRHQDASNGENPPQIDSDKIDWLSKAWDEIFKSCSELIKSILMMLQDGNTTKEQVDGLLRELLDLLENIDNAKVMAPLDGWRVLSALYQANGGDHSTQSLILQVVSAAIQNSNDVQQEVFKIFGQTIKRELTTNINVHNCKALLRILGQLYQNKYIALQVQELLGVNFCVIYRRRMEEDEAIAGRCREYYAFLLRAFKNANEDEEGYNRLLLGIASGQDGAGLGHITYQCGPLGGAEEGVRIRVK